MIRPHTIGYTLVIEATEDGDRDGVVRLVEDALRRGLTINVFRTVGQAKFLVARFLPGRASTAVRRPGATVEVADVASAVRTGLSRFSAKALAA